MRFRSLLGALLLLPAGLEAQALAVGASRWLTSPHTSQYELAVGGFGRGPLKFELGVEHTRQSGNGGARWYGGQGRLMVRTTPEARPYLLLGGALGIGRGRFDGSYGPGVGGHAGIGAELLTLGPLGLQAEATWQWRSAANVSGLSLGVRIGPRLGRSVAPAPVPLGDPRIPRAAPEDERVLRGSPPAVAAPPGVSSAPAGSAPLLAAAVVETAMGAMGAPYRWGGTGENGFDCSGLIHFAYGEHGILLPRRSVEQAAAGRAVARDLSALAPGDILTFAAQEGSAAVSHVGLYLGAGRFLHSAAGGVQQSLLAESDPVGRWWWRRWVGARRVIEGG